MDYISLPFAFRIRKVLRYIRPIGFQRALVKVESQYQMRRRFDRLPANYVRSDPKANVGIIGCGNFGFSVIAYYVEKVLSIDSSWMHGSTWM